MKLISYTVFVICLFYFASCEPGSELNSQNEDKSKTSVESDTLINAVNENLVEHSIDPITEIKNEYDLITTQLDKDVLVSKTYTYECPNFPEEGSITFYSDSSGVRMIENEAVQGSHGGETAQYYLKNNQLFFVYQVQSYWSFAAGSEPDNPSTVDHVSEYRFYMHKNELIKCLVKNYSAKDNEDLDEKGKSTNNVNIECDTYNDLNDKLSILMNQYGGEEHVNCIWL